MDADSKPSNLPPAYNDTTTTSSSTSNILDPTTLILTGTYISTTSINPTTPLYQLNQNILNLSSTQNVSSILFERVEPSLNKPNSATPTQDPTHDHHHDHHHHLFYLAHPLAHPLHAKYRTDLPAYYLTSLSPSMLGNIRLKTSKSQSRLQRTAFTALLSAGRGAKSRPLFDDVDAGEETECEGRAPLFTAKRKLKWRGDGGCKWMDGQGKEVAVEVEIAAEVEEGKQERGGEEKEKQYKLVVTASMRRDMRDALVAMWVLRRWYAMAESRRARREAMEALTPAEGYYSDMKLAKRTGALGVVGGAGC
ncbi:hypothetical protein GX50_07043 [[Emmonsia] crescens]|uniref:Uncharacterized protein n=1 Tax=[Emmonsia] crescens TaxID=73230 RepID=A0A2B7ZAK4_9EURO|nr:hypothetical protein GX50_07043 [Emmonsia crescens]